MSTSKLWTNLLAVAAFGALLLFALQFMVKQDAEPPRASYIVQGTSLEDVRAAVLDVNGIVERELGIINAVAALLCEDGVATLREDARVTQVTADGSVEVSGPVLDTFYPTRVGAHELHGQGIDGSGVTVAVLDTGIWNHGWLIDTPYRGHRLRAQYDATSHGSGDDDHDSDNDIGDANGHGSHITSILASSAMTEEGRFNGVAPGVDLVAVKAFDARGMGTYSDVIGALDWIVNNRKRYNIAVLNLSFSAAVRSHYWEDPLNQAVMVAWKEGIVVVASAGNLGPAPMSVGVPGNIPYVITVGAMTDNFTPEDSSDDVLAAFSSAGPTHDGFLKPEVVAPGGHMLGLMPADSSIAVKFPGFQEPRYQEYYEMSGTSQATAVVSGVVALMLQEDRKLNPDDVKCRLLASAHAARRADGSLAFSVFQQGAGLIDAVAAVDSKEKKCANRDMNVKQDVSGKKHYVGPARQDPATGEFYLVKPHNKHRESDEHYAHWDGSYTSGDPFFWRTGFVWNDSFLWNDSYLWNDTFLWNDSFLWNDTFLWNDSFLWNDGFFWSSGAFISGSGDAETAGINVWVERE